MCGGLINVALARRDKHTQHLITLVSVFKQVAFKFTIIVFCWPRPVNGTMGTSPYETTTHYAKQLRGQAHVAESTLHDLNIAACALALTQHSARARPFRARPPKILHLYGFGSAIILFSGDDISQDAGNDFSSKGNLTHRISGWISG